MPLSEPLELSAFAPDTTDDLSPEQLAVLLRDVIQALTDRHGAPLDVLTDDGITHVTPENSNG